MSLASLLDEQTVFTRDDAQARLLGIDEDRSPRTVDSLLAYHVRQGRLVRVRRGLYATVSKGTPASRFVPDPFSLAAKAVDDAVLAYHTALELHGRAYSAFRTFTFLTEHAVRPFRFRDDLFRPVALPRALRTPRGRRLGVEEVDRGGVPIRVTTLERTLVDSLDRLDLSGGWEEAWRSLEMVEYFDLDAVIRYALALENATTAAKVGYFLEQHQDRLMAEAKHLRKLERARPKQPHYVERSSTDNRLVPRWNLLLPRRLAERHWEEP